MDSKWPKNKLNFNGGFVAKNIQEVVNSGLCASCGACVGVCPTKAITLHWQNGTNCFTGTGLLVPSVSDRCTQCGLCYSVCPGHEVNFDELNRTVFGQIPKDAQFGNLREIYVGRSTDDALLTKVSSGGLVTALLLFALEKGFITGAVVLGMDKENPIVTKVSIARTAQEVIDAVGSKYTSGPVCTAISEILEHEGQYAVVGLPCHIEAFRKAEQQIPKLKERVAFHFGLFCQTMASYKGLKYWLTAHKINPADVAALSYRGNGWPGGMTLEFKNGTSTFYPLNDYWTALEHFPPNRCTLCPDALADLADVSFGDAWSIPNADPDKGNSIVVVRSQTAQDLLSHASEQHHVILFPATTQMLFNSQKATIDFKKKTYPARARLRSVLGKKIPSFTGAYPETEKTSQAKAALFYLNRWVYRHPLFWSLLKETGIRRYGAALASSTKTLKRFVGRRGRLVLSLTEYSTFSLLSHLPLRYPKRVRRVLIVNQADMMNKGDAAILTATQKIVQTAFPKADIVVVSHTPEVDIPRCSEPVLPSYHFMRSGPIFSNVKQTVPLLAFSLANQMLGTKRAARLPVFKRLLNETLLAYASADLVIHRGGDNLTEDYGVPYLYFESIILGILLRKPVVVLGETIGPFTDPNSRRLARTLNFVDLIITRDSPSIQTLRGLAISKPKLLALPDTAFVLSPSSDERLNQLLHSENLEALNKPVIALSVSALILRYGFTKLSADKKLSEFTAAMVKFIEHCHEKYHASFVFIPHVIGEGNDDRILSKQICNALPHNIDAHVILGEYSHEDFRAFLAAKVDLFVGARMHANIAAVSVGVPTLALAYGQKTHGILGDMLGLSDFIIDVRETPDMDSLLAEMTVHIDLLWSQRQTVRRTLTEKLVTVRKNAWKSAELLRMRYS